MNLEFLDRTIKSTLILAALFCFALSIALGLMDGFGFFIGALWSCINLLCIKHFFESLVGAEKKNHLKTIAILSIKFPLLYLIGYYLLTSNYFPLLYTLLGSSLIFAVILIFALKRLVTKITLSLIAVFSIANLNASIKGDVPEVPNIITLLYKGLHDTPWIGFLHEWENILFSVFMASFISIIFYLGARKKALIPSGLQNFVEYTVELLRKFVLEILGPEGEKYVPFLGTLFIYILSMNLLTIIPFMKPPTSSINVTAGLAIVVFVLVQFLNIRNWGLRGFLYHMAGSPKGILEWVLVPIMLPIEILTQLTRPLTLALRLFGNIAGEDILIGAASLFGVFLLSSINLEGGLPMQIPFMFLALLTGLMQALVFTILTTIYILLSMPSAEEKQTHSH